MKFHEIEISVKEEENILEALHSGHITGRGKFTLKVEEKLKSALKAPHVYMTTSGTHALEMAVRLAGVKEGDEVILPSYTFPSTANAVLLTGAKPVLVPVEPDTLSISSKTIRDYITPSTKAVIAVHYAGVCHDIDKVAEVCERSGIVLIEDAAQAYGSIYKGKALGTFGTFGCLSFHGTKNDVSGEGGALILSERGQSYQAQAERLLEKGTDRMAFLRGDQATYEWKGPGSSYVPSDLLMALLSAQLDTFESRLLKRCSIIKAYTHAFEPVCSSKVQIFTGFCKAFNTSLNTEKTLGEETRSNGHIFYICFESPKMGLVFKNHMDRLNIPVRRHFVPLHISEMGRKLGYNKMDFPFESDIFERLYRLPLHTRLSDEDISRIIEAALESIQYALEA